MKIYQDLETLSGEPYTLSYAWSPRPNHDDNELEVWWNGEKIGDHSGSGGSNMAWTLETMLVYASTGSTTRLEFVEVGTPDSRGMFLDAVSVVPGEPDPEDPFPDFVIPEFPMGTLMGLASMLAILLARKYTGNHLRS